MIKADHKEFRIGDLVSWTGHVTGLVEMTAVFGIVIDISNETIELETPAVFRGTGFMPYISNIQRKYSKELFGRLRPRILQRSL